MRAFAVRDSERQRIPEDELAPAFSFDVGFSPFALASSFTGPVPLREAPIVSPLRTVTASRVQGAAVP